jgi:hypothetical protein
MNQERMQNCHLYITYKSYTNSRDNVKSGENGWQRENPGWTLFFFGGILFIRCIQKVLECRVFEIVLQELTGVSPDIVGSTSFDFVAIVIIVHTFDKAA